MKIGIIDADMMWRPVANGRRYGKTKADIYPNLVCMKISGYFKEQGHDVDWYNALDGWYDRVYVSKVFSSTPISREIIQATEVYYGGSGYCVKLIDGKEHWQEPDDPFYMKELPAEIEHHMPDYSLYPMIKDTAYGFLSRGCPRGCSFCHVAAKEGRKSYKVADLSEWWSGQKNIVLMDPNVLACKEWKSILQQLADSKAWVDINQGIDARLLTEEKARALAAVKLKTIHFAWDDYKQKDAVLRGLRLFAQYYPKFSAAGHQAQVFVLTNFDTTHEQDLERIYTLRDMGYSPYIMVYDKEHADPFYKSLQRWVNMRAIFNTIERFEDYDKKRLRNETYRPTYIPGARGEVR